MWIDVELADIRRYVEEKRKPADPAKELHFADHSDLWRQSSDSGENLSEECKQARII